MTKYQTKERESGVDEDTDTIQRCPHDQQNPYTMVKNDLIRDATISPNCRWLLIYLLTNEKGWKIKRAQVAKHIKSFIGRDKAYKLFDEAIAAGYMKREEIPNKKYKNLKSYKYFVSETPKFKKCYRYTEAQDPDAPDPERQSYKKEDIEEITSQEELLLEPPEIPVPPDPLPAGGNNNNSSTEIYKCLEAVNDMSPKQKAQFGRYDEKIVEAGVSYCYHPNTKLQGPQARIKQLHAYCKNPADYADTLKYINDPKKGRQSNKDKLLNTFIVGKLYNGFEFYADNYGAGFIVPNELRTGDRDTWGFAWKDLNWHDEFLKIREKINAFLHTKCREPR